MCSVPAHRHVSTTDQRKILQAREVQAEDVDRRTTKLLLLLTPPKGIGLWGNEFMVVCDLLGARLGVDRLGCIDDGGVEEP